MDISQYMQTIRTRSQECAVVGLVDWNQYQSMANINNKSLIHANERPNLDIKAIKKGFTETLPKPLTIESLT